MSRFLSGWLGFNILIRIPLFFFLTTSAPIYSCDDDVFSVEHDKSARGKKKTNWVFRRNRSDLGKAKIPNSNFSASASASASSSSSSSSSSGDSFAYEDSEFEIFSQSQHKKHPIVRRLCFRCIHGKDKKVNAFSESFIEVSVGFNDPVEAIIFVEAFPWLKKWLKTESLSDSGSKPEIFYRIQSDIKQFDSKTYDVDDVRYIFDALQQKKLVEEDFVKLCHSKVIAYIDSELIDRENRRKD